MKKRMIIGMLAVLVFSVHAEDFRIACIGNSITAYKGVYPALDLNSYPAQLRILMDTGYDIQNFGVSGTTMLKNGDKPYWDEIAFTAALAFNPDRVTILLGTNDSKPQNWGPYGEAEFSNDYNAMIDTFLTLDASPEIYVCLPQPAFSSKYDITDSVIINGIVPKIQQIAADRAFPLIDFYTFFTGKPELSYDGIHPTIDGLWEYAKIFYETFTGNIVQEIEDVNLARNQTVLTPVSSGFSPANLVDGDRTTLWSVHNGGAFTIDLGVPDSLDMVQMIFNRTGCYQYTIETSNDNSTWAPLVDQSLSGDTVLVAIDSTGIVEAQYVRVTMNHADASVDSIEIAEIKILKAAPIHAPVLVPVAKRESARYAYYDLVVENFTMDGGIKYYSAEHLDSVFVPKNGYRFLEGSDVESTSFLKDKEEYYYAKYYRNNFEVTTDTVKLDYSLFTDADNRTQHAPGQIQLLQNYPNPFNPVTRICYTLPGAGAVILKIYDLLGREVQTLVNEFQQAGAHSIRFDAQNLASGIYIYRLHLGDPSEQGVTETRKMALMH